MTAEMGLPCLYESFSMFEDEGPQTIEFMCPRAVRLRETNRVQPKLGNTFIAFNVNMHRF
jgi:hypothetical protein